MIETDRARAYMLAPVFVPCSDPFVLFDKLHMPWYCGICWRIYITARCRLSDVHCFLRIFESLYASFAESAPNPWIFMVPPCSSQVWASMCMLFFDELGHHCLVQDGFHFYLSSVKSQNRANWCKLYFSIADLRACFQLVQFFSSDWWRLTPVNITGSFFVQDMNAWDNSVDSSCGLIATGTYHLALTFCDRFCCETFLWKGYAEIENAWALMKCA